MLNVAVIVGSLRKESFNRKIVMALDKLSHPTLSFSFIKIDDIPLYNQDLDSHLPESVVRFKKQISDADAVLFATPEYNRSIPGVLKNVIDWGTRPYGTNVWANKPIAVVGASPGAVGTAVAQSHFRSIMTSFGAILLPLPEIYIIYKENLVDDSFKITVEGTEKFLQGFLDMLAKELNKIK
jgi:chromate reductase, NAD(P)H dehydrogenase (quinone)